MKKNRKEQAKRLLIKVWKGLMFVQCMSFGMIAHATSLEGTKIVQGTLNLATDAGKVALVIEAVVLGVLEVIEGLKYQFGEEDEKPKHVKSAKRNLAVGALIMAGSGLVTVILNYYQA